MCIAILNKTSLLDYSQIYHSFENNSDGASFCYLEKGALKTHKELDFFKVDDFYNEYKLIREKTEQPILLHFRIGTSGKVDRKNLHPFFINKNIAMIHNGVINIDTSKYKGLNDSYHFAKMIERIKGIENLYSDKSLIDFISNYIGYSNKLVFLNTKGETLIIGEEKGHYDKLGNWYSNDSYTQCNYFYAGNKKVYKNTKSKNSISERENTLNEIHTLYYTKSEFQALAYTKQLEVLGRLYGVKNFNHKDYLRLKNTYKALNTYTLYTALYNEFWQDYSDFYY